MVIKVDLDCVKCRKKIKKVLSKIPEIQNQIYDEKANTVTISIVSCCPEKIKKKICCKGGESVKSIEIKVAEKPKPQDQKPKDPTPDKPKDAKPEKPKDEKPDKSKDSKPDEKPKDIKPDKAKPPANPEPVPVPAYPPPVGTSYGNCYEGYGGPCYGTPAPYYEPYGRPVYDSWGGGSYIYVGCCKGCYVGRCNCPCEDNSSSCRVM
ncbi:protein PYRICULARIA ORYZAE RESISTANCE 21-like isoform X2 [Mercurialis annua]|nr:protein PYRICULARIA ORYZAE RESISTANCE 21-like isoform X2 [Mercurialis annua]